MGGPAVLDRLASIAATRMHAYGATLDGELSFEEWQAIGERITRAHSGTRWALGDWLVYGESRPQYPDFYETAGAITGLGYSALRQTATLARQYVGEERKIKTTWSIYREALRLPKLGRLLQLEKSAEYRWTIEQFRSHINGLLRNQPTILPPRQIKGATSRTAAQTRTARTAKVTICPSCGHRWSD